MIELQPSARPPHPRSVWQISKGARTLRGPGFGLSGGPSFVAMVQTADLRQRYDSSHFSWLTQARVGRVLFQREMRSRSVLVSEIQIEGSS